VTAPKLNWEKVKRVRAEDRLPEAPIQATERPVASGKRYKTRTHCENTVAYLNSFGKQRALYEWFAHETADGIAWEVWHRPKVGGRRTDDGPSLGPNGGERIRGR
jgi:hypothetical protein